jgi:hypothetical protein
MGKPWLNHGKIDREAKGCESGSMSFEDSLVRINRRPMSVMFRNLIES